LLKTRLLNLSPTIVLSETFLASPREAAALEKEISAGCDDCEQVPILVGQTLTDLFAKTRPAHPCGGIKFAFALSGRTYLVSDAHDCGGDAFSATLIHDLSGKQPKLVYIFK
jgi:hypothetical protein